MKRPIRLIIFVLFIIIALSVVRVSIENSISTTGAELASLETELNTYKKNNEILKEQYLQKSSLLTISEKAKKTGFVAVTNQIYLSAPLPLALKQ